MLTRSIEVSTMSSYVVRGDFNPRVNLEKGKPIPVEETTYVEDLTSMLGGKVRSLTSTHLGLPLGAPHKSIRVAYLLHT